jgi:hypothetical protein
LGTAGRHAATEEVIWQAKEIRREEVEEGGEVMGETGLPGEIAYWAGFAVGVTLAVCVVILIARRAKKPKKRAEVNNQDELFNRRVAETIKQVESDIPEPLRPYLVYRGPVPEPLNAKWFPRELTIEAPGQEPQRVEVYQDGYGFLYARVNKAK